MENKTRQYFSFYQSQCNLFKICSAPFIIPNSYNSWTDDLREKLIQATQKFTNSYGLISWSEVAKQFPDRTKQQCKSYYQNILKDREQIQKQYKNLTIADLALFCMRVLECNEDLSQVKLRYYPNKSVEEIAAWQTQADQSKMEAFATAIFVMRYPNTDYQFSKQKLDAMKEFLNMSLQFQQKENSSEKMKEFQVKIKQMPVHDLLQKIQQILKDLKK